MRPDAEALTAALAAMSGPGVRSAARLIDASDLVRLHGSEQRHVANAVDRRRWEFASGRVLLRELLAISDPIPVGPTRRRCCRPDATGSLAH